MDSFVNRYVLSPFELALLAAISAVIIWRGRAEWAVGLHLSMALWTRNFLVGPLANLWIMAGVIVVALVVDQHRRPDPLRLPARHRGIVVWMLLWWAWMLLLIWQFDPLDRRELLRNLLLYTILPVGALALVASDVRRIRGFALAFIGASLYNGYKALEILGISLTSLPGDPALNQAGVNRLALTNYHWVAYSFALSLIMTLALFITSRRRMKLVYAGVAAVCVYFLMLCGSRQSMNAAAVVGLLLVLWGIVRGGHQRPSLLALTGAVAAIAVSLYLRAPDLVLRDDEASLDQAFDLVGERGYLWEMGMQIWGGSPIWGVGFTQNLYAHNLVIGTLADQGLVGLAFQLGLLVFVVWQSTGILRGVGSLETAAWRAAMLGVFVFGYIHGMASGAVLSTWHMFWAATCLWWLRQMVEPSALPAPVGASPVHQRSVGAWERSPQQNIASL